MAVLDPNEIFYTAYEPKQANRFILYMDGFPSYIIKQISSFAIENGEVILNHINIDRKIKGKSKWGDVTLNLYDPVTPSGAQGYSDFYKRDLTLNVLGPVGDIVSEWVLKGAYIKTATFPEFNWSTENTPVELQMALGIDYAVLNF